jgi:hypothetical protein
MIVLYNKLKLHWKIFINYFHFRKKLKGNRKHWLINAPEIYFDLNDIRQERYYYPLIFSFYELGYNITIFPNYKFIGHSFGTGKYIFVLSRVTIGKPKEFNHSIYITDNKKHFDKIKSKNSFYLNPDAFGKKHKQNRVVPYPMHPISYHFRYFEKFQQFRVKVRKAKIIFSGNTDPRAYQNSIINKRFRLINRVDVINTLLTRINPNHISIIESKENLHKKSGYFNGLLIYSWQWSHQYSKNLEIRVPDDQWHDFLATADFFLCCPGVVIPQSHNAIEAMSVGTIPVLQYADYFHPELIDGVNCITFTDEQELLKKVNSLFVMPQDKISSMRNAVIDYYERYLRHDAAAKMLLSLGEGHHEIFFYNESE